MERKAEKFLKYTAKMLYHNKTFAVFNKRLDNTQKCHQQRQNNLLWLGNCQKYEQLRKKHFYVIQNSIFLHLKFN